MNKLELRKLITKHDIFYKENKVYESYSYSLFTYKTDTNIAVLSVSKIDKLNYIQITNNIGSVFKSSYKRSNYRCYSLTEENGYLLLDCGDDSPYFIRTESDLIQFFVDNRIEYFNIILRKRKLSKI